MTEPLRGGALQPKDELSRRLGEQFKRVRQRSGLTLRSVSLATGHGRYVYLIRRHEAGSLTLRADDLVKAAHHMGVDPAELVSVTMPQKEKLDG
jgi:hypothetical protein